MNKSLIVYFSLTGNTERLAHLIGDLLKEKGRNADYFKLIPEKPASFLRNCREAMTKRKAALKELPDFSGYDTIFIGSPVWAFNIAPAVRGLLESVSLSGRNVFIFATHGGTPGKAMKEFANAVESKGGKVVGAYVAQDKRIPEDSPNLASLLDKIP